MMPECFPYRLAAGCALLLTLAACSKNDSTPSERLAGRWKLTAKTASYTVAGFNTTRDVYGTLAACKQDDLVVYNSDGTYSLDEGTSTCNPGDAQTTPLGNWALDETGMTLTQFPSSGAGSVLTVAELGVTTLRTTQADSIALGPVSYRSQTTSTYTRQ